jgi:hypothetical protein
LLELGVGFAFVGSQHRVQVGSEELYLDLLFYHLKLRAFVDRVVAENSLRDVSRPIGVSEYQLSAAVPEKLRGTLPTIGELENELSE